MTHLNTIFARFWIPTILVTDNGPQFDSQDIKKFDHAYEFQRPYYSQVNVLVERMVKTIKKLLEHPADLYKVILSYRTISLP